MRIRTVARLGLLLSLKESYLFFRNSLGLIWHPFKTLAIMSREKDRSQQLLFLVLPGAILVFGVGMMWLEKKWSAIILLTLSLALFIYLVFWQMRVWLKK